MKIAGWICTVFGGLALIGCLMGGSSAFGPLFWLGLGIYLIHRANEKKREKQEFEDWSNK